MDNVKVAINGFGRIGRLIFRQIYDLKGIDVVAVNDLTSPAVLAHLLKYDTAQGRFYVDVITKESSILVNGKMIKVYAQKDPSLIPWKDQDVDIILECTGYFADKDKASAHLAAGARKVIISASAIGELKTIVFNVNHQILDGSENIISCGSSVTNGLVPMAKVLDDHFGIVNAMMNTLHAYTNDQKTQDSPHPKGDLRRSRAAAHNIISGDAALVRVLPNLRGKMDGVIHRVPVFTGSITELACTT